MKPKNMEEALALVPEYWPLVPGVDKWKKEDEICQNVMDNKWCKVDFPFIAKEYGPIIDDIARRPIPQSIREAEAFWILYNSLATIDADYYGSDKPGWVIRPLSEDDRSIQPMYANSSSMNKFESRELALDFCNKVGNDREVIQIIVRGTDALWSWVMENRK